MDPILHKRYLDYRERHTYFGGKKVMLTAAEFTEADGAYRALAQKGEEGRDDEEEARFAELAKALHRD